MLKRYFLTIVLFAIPFITFLTSMRIIEERGKDWYGSGYDPSYAYLYNSLNIATFKLVGHIDHPGTTTQGFGGLVLKAAYLFDDQGESSIKEAVLKHPEFYLKILKIATLLFCCLMLFLFGWIAFRYTSNIWLGIIIQLSPYISGVILFNSVLRLSQESMFMLASIGISLLAVLWYKRDTRDSSNLFIILFALISGFGLASKIIFAPLMIIPLLCLRLNKERIRYLLFSIIAFVIFTLPIIPLYPNMAWWFIRLFLHSGIYGSGEANIIDSSTYIINLKALLLAEPLYLFLYSLTFVSLVFLALVRLFKTGDANKKAFFLLLAVFVAQTAGYLITAKHPKVAYLLPYECISVVTIAVIIDLISKLFNRIWLKSMVSGIFVISLTLFMIKYGLKERKELYNVTSNIHYQRAWEVANSKKAVIGINPGPSPIAAMFFGNAYSRNRYSDDLMQVYPDYYIFDTYSNTLIDWKRKEFTFDELVNKYGKSIAVIGFDLDYTLKNISSVSVYEFEKIVTEKVQVLIIKE